MCRLSSLLSAVVLLLAIPSQGLADGFGIDTTRLIYPEGASSISTTLHNSLNATPYLIQLGFGTTPGGAEPTPFIVTPPLFRLEPGRKNQVRISARDTSKLAKDRESIFYFRASAIPASKKQNDGQQAEGVRGTVQFGVGNIIKLFYRPSGLAASSTEAQERLQFSRQGTSLKVSNPSPYFINMASLQVAGKTVDFTTAGARMIAPFGAYTYTVPDSQGRIEWQTINDQGGLNAFSHAQQ